MTNSLRSRMTNMLLEETTNRLNPRNTTLSKEQTQIEIIDIPSDDDSDIIECTASRSTTHKLVQTDSFEHSRRDKVATPVLRQEAYKQASPDTDPRHRKRQKVVHNNHADSTIATKQERQKDPIVPPLPELANIDWNFDDDFLAEGFGGDIISLSGTYAAYTTFPPFTESELKLEGTEASSSKKTNSKPLVKKKAICPYYEDLKWGTLMFCGPGHEEFPVVFDTNEDHEQIRQKWDSMVAARVKEQVITSEFTQKEINPSNFEYSDEGETEDNNKPNEVEMSCFLRIRQILPDIEQDFVIQTIRLQTSEQSQPQLDIENDTSGHPTIDGVLEAILENGPYPKAKNKAEEESNNVILGKTVPLIKGDPKNPTYTLDCIGVLAAYFDRIPTYEISNALVERKWLYDTFLYFERAEEKYHVTEEKSYKRLQKARINLEKKYESRTLRVHTNTHWRNLINEFQAAKQQIAREDLRAAREKEDEEFEAKNLASQKESGNIVECKCCFDEEIPLNRAVMCEGDDELHWFCFSCVKNLAATQLGMMRYEMLCVDGSGCKAPLSKQSLVQAVPTKILDNLDLLQQQAEILAAGITLEQCPHCDFQASCEGSIFRCQNPICGRFTCRDCQQDAHAPRTCEEVKADKSLSAKHMVEEARSEATIRECPKCKVKIIKESGCNKIICTKCACISCYVCRKDISNEGYKHFGPTPGQPDYHAINSTSTCKLYGEGSNRHEADADNAEREVIERMRLEDPNLNEEEVRIGTGSKKKHKAKAHTARQHRVYNDVRAMRGPHLPRLMPEFPMPRAPRLVNALENRMVGFMPPHYLGQLRPAANFEQVVDLPRLHVNDHEADIVAPVDHGAVLATAQRVHAAVAEQHARTRRRLNRARATMPAFRNDDQLGGDRGADLGMNLDGAFDYEPIHHPPRAYTNPQLDWHQIHDRYFPQPAVGDHFAGFFADFNGPALHHNLPDPPQRGLEWRGQKLFDEPGENRSIYEDALEML